MDQGDISAFEGQALRNQRLTLLGDGAQTVDLLGYQPYVDAMVEVLAQEHLQTPFSVGVFGRWGTGKSTFMNLLYEQLSKDKRQAKSLSGGFHALKFEPWQFEEKEEVWKALLLSVIRYLEKVQEQRSSPGEQEALRIRETLRSLALSVGKLALNKTLQTMTSGAVGLDQVLEAFAANSRDNSQFINTFRHQFGELKAQILQDDNSKARLFVFVDDLDRCTPDNCIMVLEAIKLFFDLPECVFVLGIDREVVQKGIEVKYHRSVGIHGQDYIDKLIQLPFSLPPIQMNTFEAFVSSITADFGFGPEIRALIVRAADGNPRSAKRLSNCLQLTRTVADRLIQSSQLKGVEGDVAPSKIALLLTLQVRYPVAYRWLSRHPVTLEELGTGWHQLPGSISNGAGSNGYRAQLVAFLKDVYGDRVAEQNADGFFALWRHAHEKIKVQSFTGPEDLVAYMRITGIVEEERAREYVKAQTPTGRDGYDQHYVREAEPEVELDALSPSSEEPEERPTGDPDARSGDLLLEGQSILRSWDEFEDVTVLRAVYALPSLMRNAQKLPNLKDELMPRMAQFFDQFGSGRYYELEDIQSKLTAISRARGLRHVRAIAGSFAILWPIAAALLGAALEMAARATIWSEIAAPEVTLTWLRKLTAGPVKFGVLELVDSAGIVPLGQFVLSIPDSFPGGPVFFWTAAIYALFALTVWRRARNALEHDREMTAGVATQSRAPKPALPAAQPTSDPATAAQPPKPKNSEPDQDVKAGS